MLAADLGHSLLSARSLAENVISVVVSAELLRQADRDPPRLDVAASWVERRMIAGAVPAWAPGLRPARTPGCVPQ